MPTDSFVDLEFKGKLVNVRKSQVQNAVDAIEKRITEPVSVNCLIGPVSVFSPWDTVEDITIKVIQHDQAVPQEKPSGVLPDISSPWVEALDERIRKIVRDEMAEAAKAMRIGKAVE